MAQTNRDRARPPAPKTEPEVVGRRYIRLIEHQLARLHAHPAHGNREVFLDHLVIAHLPAFFNPGLRGLRSIDEVFGLPQVRKRYRTPRLPKSTLADAKRVFDPHLLWPLIESLKQRAGLRPHDPRLDALTRRLLAVDGSFFAVAPRIAWALFNKASVQKGARRNLRQGNVRVHVQFDVLRGLPDQATLTDGQASEAEQLRRALRSGCFYVMDRGFQQYTLLADILAAGSDFLVRLRKSARCTVVQECPLSTADIAASVTREATVTVGWRTGQVAALPPLRRVEVTYTDRQGKTTTLILLTNRLDLPAWMIALVYRHRWQIELFFRWLKCIGHFQHFFSESPQGMTLQLYVTLIGLLLMAIETGARPSKYDFALFSAAVNGLAPLEEVLAVAAKRRAERARAAEWQRQYSAKKAAQKSGR